MSIRRVDEEDRIGRPARRSAAGEWTVKLAGGVVECCALLFAVGAAFGLLFGGRLAYGLWQDRQEQQATLHQARRDCAGRYDPEGWGTAQQQFDGCVSDRMEPWTFRTEVHSVVFLFVAAPYLFSMGIAGLTGFLAWDYRRDPRERDARLGAGLR
jgi:hypothetical protein